MTMTTAQRQRRRARIRADLERALEAIVEEYKLAYEARRRAFDKTLTYEASPDVFRMVALFHLAEVDYQTAMREACTRARRRAEVRAQGHKREHARALRQNATPPE